MLLNNYFQLIGEISKNSIIQSDNEHFSYQLKVLDSNEVLIIEVPIEQAKEMNSLFKPTPIMIVVDGIISKKKGSYDSTLIQKNYLVINQVTNIDTKDNEVEEVKEEIEEIEEEVDNEGFEVIFTLDELRVDES
ncbi:hypothetical protein SAMN05421767_1048 [Granulicatella balaenopterae]|uniref:Uncharacterized protein n=1 Tax=Granulicatella balaenopterae TaxID=137733 RepID=A0A1H9HZL0_9LACT|nr:hypothetical protein [Granulicatella balaenopterae]SEQ67800.1 hypothetical protein SAMN05421767_1048 [Granulicatella balaenopterae]